MIPDLSDPQRHALLWLAKRITEGKAPTVRVLRGLRERGFVNHVSEDGARTYVLSDEGKSTVDKLMVYLDRKTVATTLAPWFKNEPRRACRNADPRLFFPPAGSSQQAKEAKAICSGCKILTACLDYALPITDLHGIWGGTNKGEREAIRRGAQPRPDQMQAVAA